MSDRWKTIERIYHSTLERSEQDRAAYLESVCAGDDALRKEVESLLRQEKGAKDFLDAPAIQLAAGMFDEPTGQSIIGRRLGTYQVVSLIGSGGMGEVYEAHDSKLRRDVAIKVLPSAFLNDSQRLSRFQREARVLASLNHPNIATIHGLEQSDGVHYLVMELVPGKTLAERITKNGLPLDEALKIAKQIAVALEAAHDKGVIHRDLKPANVKVTPEGHVKVLDFGLAKAFDNNGGPDLSNAPTLSGMASEEGRILGTPAYMSPEQARGDAVDKRTDIWAFGCVLYELLTGKRAFSGENVTDILAAVIMKDPIFDALPTNTPASIRVLLRRCLRKDKRQRISDASDVRIEIEDAIAAPNDLDATQAAPAYTSKLLLAAGVVAVIVTVLLGVASWGWWQSTRPVDRPLVRMDVALGPDVSLGSAIGIDEIISPDGMRIVYLTQNRLFTRRLDQPNATELVGTQGASAPFFSPDGQWVAFSAQGKLQKISVEGGPAITVCDAPAGMGGSWGEDGDIIFNTYSRLARVSSAGGSPTTLTGVMSGETTHRWPQILPGGKAILFTVEKDQTGFDTADIEAMSLADHRRKTLIHGGTFGRYLPSGHLIYVNRGTLFAVPFDADHLEVHGTPVPVLDQVSYNVTYGSAQMDFSQTGTLIYRSGGATGGVLVTVAWLDGAGKVQPLLAKPGAYVSPSVSPDGQRLALEVSEGLNSDIWVYDWQRDRMTRLTFTGKGHRPVWSPDSRYIAFSAFGEGMSVIRSDGSGMPLPLTQSKNNQLPWSFAPDGRRVAFFEGHSGGVSLFTLPLESDSAGLHGGKPEVFLQSAANEWQGSFSPDGRWMAYTSNESGTGQIYVRAFPDKGGKWQISSGGGEYPVWSRTGRELFFETLDHRIMVAAYAVKGDSFEADKPRVWSEKQLGGSLINFDLAPDGKRIAAIMPLETAETQEPPNQVTFLMNFSDELRRKVPGGK